MILWFEQVDDSVLGAKVGIMARQIAKFVHGNKKYPWEQWQDGKVWQLVRGEDYTLPDLTMQKCIQTRAARVGMKANTSRNEEGLVIQFHPRPKPDWKKIRPRKTKKD